MISPTTPMSAESAALSATDAVHVLRLALVQAECAIKGREHTGFITKALVATEHIAAITTERAAIPDADTLHFNAQRLRNVAKLVGLKDDAIPDDDEVLEGARGAVLGMIAGQLRERAAIQPAGEAVYQIANDCIPSGWSDVDQNTYDMWNTTTYRKKRILFATPVPQDAKAEQVEAPEGFALVPLQMTRAMRDVTDGEDWQWEDLLAAAEAITEEQYNAIAAAPETNPPAQPIAADVRDAARRYLTCVNERSDASLDFSTADGHTEYERARSQLLKALAAQPSQKGLTQ